VATGSHQTATHKSELRQTVVHQQLAHAITQKHRYVLIYALPTAATHNTQPLFFTKFFCTVKSFRMARNQHQQHIRDLLLHQTQGSKYFFIFTLSGAGGYPHWAWTVNAGSQRSTCVRQIRR
jgi:hypothetical protein